MNAPLSPLTEFNLGHSVVRLLAERGLWLPAVETLVVGDLHFGKVNHFRRAGLPVPLAASQRNAERLIDLINVLRPNRTIFLGDLFHSVYNDDWEVVGQIVKHYPACQFQLIRGNHDILSEQQYVRYGISVHEQAVIGDLLLTHDPMELSEIPSGLINVAGHIHPAAQLVGRGRQSLTFPCFWHSTNRMVIPAFGTFTGLAIIHPEEHDTVYILVDNKIMELRPEQQSGSQPLVP